MAHGQVGGEEELSIFCELAGQGFFQKVATKGFFPGVSQHKKLGINGENMYVWDLWEHT